MEYKLLSSSSPSASSASLPMAWTQEVMDDDVEEGGLNGQDERKDDMIGSLAWVEMG